MKLKSLKFLAIAGTMFLFSCGGEKAADKAGHKEEAAKEEVAHEEAAPEVEAEEVVAEEVDANAAGKELFKSNGCVACHQPTETVVGPALNVISAAYEGNEAGMISFFKEEAEAIVDPAQFAIMQANLAVTKAMSDEDLTALTDYIMSVK